MDMKATYESSKWNRTGFLYSLNRSFRLVSGKSKTLTSHDTATKSPSLKMDSLPGLNNPEPALRPLEIVAPRIDTYRFSMANLEETQDADLDAILGELCALDSECDEEISRVSLVCSSTSKDNNDRSNLQQQDCNKDCVDGTANINRTDSPDNDSAFSDTVSMLSSESSASSSASTKCKALKLDLHQKQKDASFQQKADKIKLALERMREANIKKLFIKAFSVDGSSKSLLVDEKMTCGYVTRLLADKNHVTMEPRWTIVEHLPDLFMERVYEDHEMLVDNLMLWTRESKNKILFAERPDKIQLFQTPEKFLLSEDDRGWCSEHDEHSRQVILEEFFGQNGGITSIPSISGHPVPHIEGPLYLKSDAKKGWKKYHFVLRPSGLYYSPKEKTKSLKELVCLATFDTNEVYIGINWRKKYKSPTDYCFAIKHPRLQQPKSVKFIKFLCADDQQTLERWITAMRIAKHGRQLLENYRSLVEELTQEDLDNLAHARSCSVTSIPAKTNGNVSAVINSPAQSTSSNASVANSDISSGRHSRASSSSSSGCMSDGGTASESAFDCEFPMGTIKRKPSMKPNIPLTWMTRQLKEMAEKAEGEDPGDGGTLTRRPRNRTDDSTLKRHNSSIDGEESVYSTGSIMSRVSAVSESRVSTASESRVSIASESRVSTASVSGISAVYSTVDPTYIDTGVDELPPPPPPDDALYASTLDLDELPPPPPPLELVHHEPLPAPPPAAFPRQPSLDSVSSSASRTSSDKTIYGHHSAYGACLVEMQTKTLGSPSLKKKDSRCSSLKKVNFPDDITDKKPKKISFNLTGDGSPRKPPPPKRNESTRLSSPKKLSESSSNPPKEFLKDLQRVMRKKWQVAQKCAVEGASVHEVLGFREYPLSESEREASVSMWVREHYGRRAALPPPPPPPRSGSTHLTRPTHTIQHTA